MIFVRMKVVRILVILPVIPLLRRLLKASFLGDKCGACPRSCAGADGGRGKVRSSGDRRGGLLLRRCSEDRLCKEKKQYESLIVVLLI